MIETALIRKYPQPLSIYMKIDTQFILFDFQFSTETEAATKNIL